MVFNAKLQAEANKGGGAVRRPRTIICIAIRCVAGWKDGYQESSALRVQGGGQDIHRLLLQGDSGHESEWCGHLNITY